ncbi:MAG: SurA N-terminal domain-containing protein [Candidatus Woesearchaeota archaeon]
MGLVETKKTITEKPLLWFGIAIVVLSLIALSVVLVLKMNSKEDDKNVLAIVGGEKIYQKDLNERIYGLEFEGTLDKPKDVSNFEKKRLLNILIAAKIAEKELASMNISVTDEEVISLMKERLGGVYENYTDYQAKISKKALKSEILINKIKEKQIAWRAGEFFICRFDLPYEIGKDSVNTEESKARYAKDKEYAKKLCNNLYEEVKSGKITFAEAMKKAEADSVIGKPLWQETYVLSASFTKDDFEQQTYFEDDFWNVSLKSNKGKLTAPEVVKLKNDFDNNQHEAFYAVFNIKEEGDGSYSSYESWFEAMKSKYKVEYKVNY